MYFIASPVATLGSKFFFHGSCKRRGSLPRRAKRNSGSHSCTLGLYMSFYRSEKHSALLRGTGQSVLIHSSGFKCSPQIAFASFLATGCSLAKTNNAVKIFASVKAASRSSRTCVRRKRRCPKNLCPANKNLL